MKETTGTNTGGTIRLVPRTTSTIVHRFMLTMLLIGTLIISRPNCRIDGRFGSTNISFVVEAFVVPTRSVSSTTLSSTSTSTSTSNRESYDGLPYCIFNNRMRSNSQQKYSLAVLAASKRESSTANGSNGAAKARDSGSRPRPTGRAIKKDPSYDENDADSAEITIQNIKELREEMRQLLTGRPSRNIAVDATILLKKMMGTRVYEKGRRSDQINVIDCTKVISTISKSGHELAPQMALSILKDMTDLYKKGNKFIRPDSFAYTSVINAYARRGDVDGASKVFKMQVGDFKQSNNTDAQPDIRTYSVMMDAWAKSGRADAVEAVENLFLVVKKLSASGALDEGLDVVTYSTVIDCWSKSGRKDSPAKALEYLNDMKAMGIDPDVRTYNGVLGAHAKQGDLDGAMKVFEMMQGGEVKPDLVTYNILIDAWAKSGRSDAPGEAMKLLLTIKYLHAAGNVDEPDIITFTTALDAHAKQGDLDGAMKVFEMMSSGEVKPNLQSYSILLDAWAKSGRAEAPTEAMNLLMTIKDLNAAGKIDAPTIITYNTALDAHAKQGDVDGAMKVFEMMPGGEVKPDLLSYIILIDAWAKSGRAEAPAEAMKLLMTIKDLYVAGEIDAPTIITFNRAMDAHAKQGEVDGVLKVFEMMSGGEVKPDLWSYTILLDAWAESGRSDAPEQAEELLKKMEALHRSGDLDEPPDVQIFGALHKCWNLSGRKDKQTIERMAQLRRQLNR